MRCSSTGADARHLRPTTAHPHLTMPINNGEIRRTSKPCLGKTERIAVQRVLDSAYLGAGPETQGFEDELAAYLGGTRSVVCVSSGTAALHLALAAAGLGPGDEVLVPSLTYVASFQAIAATGALPVACDVRRQNALIDLDDARLRLTDSTRAIMPVHFAGHCGDLAAVYAFAASHRLRVIEDAAHAFGSRYENKLVGSIGDLVCFSFDPIKNITAGQGGAVVTGDALAAARIRSARDLGIERVAAGRDSADFDVTHLGWRYALSDLMAAIGRAQLGRFEVELKPYRQMAAATYRRRLADVDGITLLDSGTDVVPHILPVRIAGGARDTVRAALMTAGYETRVHYKPNHLLRAFAAASPLPVCEGLYHELLTLPLHGGVNADDIESIARIVEEQLARALKACR